LHGVERLNDQLGPGYFTDQDFSNPKRDPNPGSIAGLTLND
jgi:hypothetical protein